jgi:hypothetical protein
MLVTNAFSFLYPQVKNKPCVHWEYAFILVHSTVANSKYYSDNFNFWVVLNGVSAELVFC